MFLSPTSSNQRVNDSSIPCDPADYSSDSEASASSPLHHHSSPNSHNKRLLSNSTNAAPSSSNHKKVRLDSPKAPLTVLPAVLPAVSSAAMTTATVSTATATTTLSPEEESLRNERLHSLDAVFDAFNICDIEALFALIRQRFHPDLQFIMGSDRETYNGPNALFTYWNFAHEIYPDAMVKVLERRIISVALPHVGNSKEKRSEWRVECVYKFTGTRITGSSIYETFSNFMITCGESVEQAQKYEELAMSMVRFITANNGSSTAPMHPTDPDEARSCIVEVVLSFDAQTQLIKQWSMELLAGDER